VTREELIRAVEREADAPLDRLDAAERRALELHRLADGLVEHFVECARAEGCSWTEIGATFGISKQAAQQRFAGAPPLAAMLWPAGFDDRAREAVGLAEREARALGHGHVGTEHLLLGLASQGDGPAARALDAFDVTADKIRQAIEAEVGLGPARSGDAALRFRPRAKKALDLAQREARRLGHQPAGTGHLMLGVAGVHEGVGARILGRLGVTLERLREQLGVPAPPPRRRRRLRRHGTAG
jgi:hypothetical protein